MRTAPRRRNVLGDLRQYGWFDQKPKDAVRFDAAFVLRPSLFRMGYRVDRQAETMHSAIHAGQQHNDAVAVIKLATRA